MPGAQRFVFIAIAAAIAIVAFVAIRPGDEDGDNRPETSSQQTTTTDTRPSEPNAAAAPPAAEAPPPEPRVERIRVRGGKPVGGEQRLRFETGETIRLVVSSDAPHEVHVHGYDIVRDVAPGRPARFRFEAHIEGIFEIELEDITAPLGELRVEP